MSINLFLPLEQAKKGLNADLSENNKDHDIIEYILAAQDFFENYTLRKLDAEIEETEYKSGANNRSFPLRTFPVRSVTSLHIDNGHDFTADSLIDTDSYWAEEEAGILWIKGTFGFGGSAGFPVGENNVKIVYKGGWIGVKEVVASASPSASHTVADGLSSYSQPFYVFVGTTGDFSANAGVVITGTDENGNALSETVIPNNACLDSTPTFSFAKAKFKTITTVNSSGLTDETNGEVYVKATSTPADLRLALSRLCAIWLREDEQNMVNVSSRSVESATETFDTDEIPPKILRIMDQYRNLTL